MKLKKLSALLLSAIILFSCGCSKTDTNSDTQGTQTTAGDALNHEETTAEKEKGLATADAGDSIFLGSFEQDGITDNGAEKIEWIILEKSESEAILLSKYILDVMPWYNSPIKFSTWETSDVRLWLNDDFYNTAFSEAEKNSLIDHNTEISEEESAKVREIILSNSNTLYTEEEINHLKNYTGYDKVFLIDQNEYKKYFNSPSQAIAQGSNYAISKRLYTSGDSCLWWLRDAGIKNAAYVTYEGEIYDGTNHEAATIGVRPAIRVKF